MEVLSVLRPAVADFTARFVAESNRTTRNLFHVVFVITSRTETVHTL